MLFLENNVRLYMCGVNYRTKIVGDGVMGVSSTFCVIHFRFMKFISLVQLLYLD